MATFQSLGIRPRRRAASPRFRPALHMQLVDSAGRRPASGDSRDSGGPRHGCGVARRVLSGRRSLGGLARAVAGARAWIRNRRPTWPTGLRRLVAGSERPSTRCAALVTRSLANSRSTSEKGVALNTGLRRQRPRRRARRLTSPQAKACENPMCDEVHACWRRSSSPRGSADGRTQLALCRSTGSAGGAASSGSAVARRHGRRADIFVSRIARRGAVSSGRRTCAAACARCASKRSGWVPASTRCTPPPSGREARAQGHPW